MHDPIAAGRHLAFRAAAASGVVTIMLAFGLLTVGWMTALAALLGGTAWAVGNALAAQLSLPGILPAPRAFARLLVGVGAKWLVVIAVFAVALGIWRLPPLPMLAGLALAMLVQVVALQVRAITGVARNDSNDMAARRRRV